ncbi:MAG: hypothetical protein Q8O48_08265, partial [Anaerolineales bacterium]|nr:hypothetical protein [Anaerolineales bacterium]
MRKLYLVIGLVIIMQACSINDFFLLTNTDSPKSTPTTTSVPFLWPTITRNLPATATPMIVRFPTFDPYLPTETVVPMPLFIGTNTITPYAPLATFKSDVGFALVTVADNKIFWGGCTPNKTTILAQVEDPDEIFTVTFFTQVKSAKEEDYTPWTSGNAMFNHQDGTFSYVMIGSEVEGHNHYKNSWVRFQLVATNIKGEEVGRTRVYTEAIALSPCMCSEPLK